MLQRREQMGVRNSLGPNAGLVGQLGSRHQLSTPALVLDLDRLERNIGHMAAVCRDHGVMLRPHAKTHKSVNIAKLQMEAGAVGICCATLGEAETMVASAIPGVLITSPVVTSPKIERLIELNRLAEDLMVVADHPANVAALATAAAEAGTLLRVLVDFDTGMHRTGVSTVAAGVALARQVQGHDSLDFAGVQAYYGHLQHVEDFDTRAQLAATQYRTLQEFIDQLEDVGMPPSICTGAGTGTHAIDACGPFSELQAGSYIFMDVEYEAVDLEGDGGGPFAPALFVATTVVSCNAAGFVTTDGGLKRFATDGPKPRPAHGAPAGSSYEFLGDEHGMLILPQEARLGLGAVIECLTPHCDPTVNLYDHYHIVRNDKLVAIWPVDARGAI
jgi:D-serine deaminase-like pyridoxal phosphate-dependent protein